MLKEIVRLIDETCVIIKFPIFAKLLELLLQSICVQSQTHTELHNSTEQYRFKGLGGSVCIVLCPQELKQQSVLSYVHLHFSVAHALHNVSLLSRIESG